MVQTCCVLWMNFTTVCNSAVSIDQNGSDHHLSNENGFSISLEHVHSRLNPSTLKRTVSGSPISLPGHTNLVDTSRTVNKTMSDINNSGTNDQVGESLNLLILFVSFNYLII